MKASTLNAVIKIISRISNPSSLTSLYKSVEIHPESVRACSEFGNIEIFVESTGVKDSCLLNVNAFSAITANLAGDADLELIQEPTRFEWKSEGVKGHLSYVHSDYSVPKIKHALYPWTPPADLGNALVLASSACQAAAVSLGLYGIVIQPDIEKGKLNFASTNTISLASSSVDLGSYPGKKVTVRPPVPGIIATLLAASPNCNLDITDEGIFILGDTLTAQLPLGSELVNDVKAMGDAFVGGTQIAKINTGSVKKFIKRASSLTDKKTTFNISLKVEEGRLILTHTGISSSTEQWMLADGLDATVAYESKTFDAAMLLVPLEFITDIVLDFLPTKRLVLRGSEPDFLYVVAGT